jgi:Na+-transporting NADH:ubiquinone oxidoreductase subunit NqrB
MVLAAVVAIGSKFLLKIRDKHIFNPANLGIVAALTLTPGTWISPGQWGEEGWYALLFCSAAGLVLQRIGRWDTSVTFLGSYTVLETARSLWLGWTWDVTAHRLMSGSLLIFVFFMVTDPRSIPDRSRARILWALGIAFLTFMLRNQFFLATAPFWALFWLAPLSPVLDYFWPSDRFEWSHPPQ